MSNSSVRARLEEYKEKKSNWKFWGPYLSERAWGTVREDYSADGDVWAYFPHDHARSRAYRWGEDGIGGISDRSQYLCFAVSFWNEEDPILKERMFGLSGPESNHGEDVKEYYYYLDNTPCHSYMRMLYKYPQARFPYETLLAHGKSRGYEQGEFELLDTGIFHEGKYFDILIEYAKASEEDICIKITIYNRSKHKKDLHILPTLWFRNTWSWGYDSTQPRIKKEESFALASHKDLGEYHFYIDQTATWLFTNNETNKEKLFSVPNDSPYVKDAFHSYLIEGRKDAVNPEQQGTKCTPCVKLSLEGHTEQTICLRLTKQHQVKPFDNFSEIFALRKKEADEFYDSVHEADLSQDHKMIQRQAWSGLLWSKQFYHLDVAQWLQGDPSGPPPPLGRDKIRNAEWKHLFAFDIFSLPDTWEYPYFCSWDSAFHMIPYAMLDPEFAKRQMLLLTREWYLHPNGALPAYEWSFSDVNPPVHAWGAFRTYKIEHKYTGNSDLEFLKAVFHKLLMNFTWWVNKKDAEGNNIFQGGFLGMDNISVFDRSHALPFKGRIDQSDGTAWMGFYSIIMMKISLEIAKTDPCYQDLATKFFEHFLRIAHAMSSSQERGHSLWDEQDGFFYDVLTDSHGNMTPLRVRSLVGLLSLLPVETIDNEILETMPVFKRRMEWFLSKKAALSCAIEKMQQNDGKERYLMSLLTHDRIKSVLRYMLDENEFLSPYGIRSISKIHKDHPFVLAECKDHFQVDYEPAESRVGLFGGNSNWRGPIWIPMNFLIIESLQKYHHYYGNSLQVEMPTGSGHFMNLWDVAAELSKRIIKIFTLDENEKRAVFGPYEPYSQDPHWKELILFHEYYHGDTGMGLGASHQTGWSALVAKLIQQSGKA